MDLHRFPFKALLVDMDGVLWKGQDVIQRNVEAVRDWKKSGGPVRFLTNNSTRTRDFYVRRLSQNGILVDSREIITSAWVASIWLKKMKLRKVFIIGEEGLVHEIRNQGIAVVRDHERILTADERVDAVVVGMDRELTYRKLWAGLRALDQGTLFLVTNEDPNFPLPTGRAPGGGAIAAALSMASERKPDVVIGKPERPIFEIALRDLNLREEEILMVGDRLETDILGAKRMGIKSLLVLTGIDSLEDIQERLKPDFVAEDLVSFFTSF